MRESIIERLNQLSTPHLADACLRTGVPVRCAPSDLQAIDVHMHCAGRVLPARHTGSVDIFLEALEYSRPGDVLIVDDLGRHDRSCVGDMITREVKMAGLAGIIIWGCHRDTCELLDIGLPLFSEGKISTGPLGVERRSPDALEWARVGQWIVTKEDVAVGDRDGVIFLPFDRLMDIVPEAEAIRDTERKQAELLYDGISLREQLNFREYLEKHENDTSYDFRKHLQKIGGAVEV